MKRGFPNKKRVAQVQKNLSYPHGIQGIGGFSAKFFVLRGVRRTCVRRVSKTEKENDFVFVEKFVEFQPNIIFFSSFDKKVFFLFSFRHFRLRQNAPAPLVQYKHNAIHLKWIESCAYFCYNENAMD